MSHYIVLVKQVPDVSQITDNAFDPKTGNLIRTRLPSVINELDAQGLAFAWKMRNLQNDPESKVICLTMGPPMAAEVLKYGLSRCADDVVLLTDRALGGADTFATANPLAYGIRKIVKDKLGGTDDYFVVSGMQSVDGDTAQVPAQIAEEMKVPCIPYATDAEYINGKFRFTRIIAGGSQVVEAHQMPAVVTVAKYEYPLFATFAASRKAERAEMTQWTAKDIGADNVGVKGSKTRVIRVFPPGKTTRKCQEVTEVKELAKLIAGAAGKGGAGEKEDKTEAGPSYVPPARRESKFDRSYEGTDKENDDFKELNRLLSEMKIEDVNKIDGKQFDEILEKSDGGFHKKALEDMLNALKSTETSYSGEVWVMAEHGEDKINSATFELTGKARELADSLGTKVGVCIAGDAVKKFTDELIHAGADKVYVIEDPLLKEFDPTVYRKAVADCVAKYDPQIVLYGATPQGRVLAPMVSYRLKCGLTADCTGLEIRDSSRKGQVAILFQTRPALGGNIMATIVTKDSECQMATAREGVMTRLEPDTSRTGEVIEHKVELKPEDQSLDIIKTEMATGQVNFEADVITAGGKGMQDRDEFDSMIDMLNGVIGDKFGVSTEKGASRAAVEQGFIDRVHQVGQTGTAVGPELYIAIGISGAIQHMIGVSNSETIVAINSDPNAPILKQCDYYMIGTADDIVPKLVEELKEA
ncbi:Electron transfer flavoprotein large subunit [Anaerohalosphaera lusitana]|uniref:Electron transfer flavoprotein large subunit n=1 Tax=Anaerohalosphaera lusitana TaxID=1936003 RepID=A0A1U9NI92_9BACT|nr:FAD-binding protein [Anaerohalosphaera lusitana]AQT67444.1 Electron transfer flavoprotein large subunit [Anaerohalosphaera lusitana]